MRPVARYWGAFSLVLAWGVGSSCERIDALREKWLGAAEREEEAAELEMAIELYESGQISAAIESLQAVTEREPTSADAFYYLGRCFLAAAGDQVDPSQP
ncbi:MAG: hypothetical protein ACE5JI_22070, partial [Acidobacteriota bacterium]